MVVERGMVLVRVVLVMVRQIRVGVPAVGIAAGKLFSGTQHILNKVLVIVVLGSVRLVVVVGLFEVLCHGEFLLGLGSAGQEGQG